MKGLSKYYNKNYHDFKKKKLKLFMEYSKNKVIQKWAGVAHVIAFTPNSFLTMVG
jgi:hypothetical protein